MYGCESWTIKKAECQRSDTFELRCRRRLLRVIWTARRSNQSVLREINPEYSLDRLMLKLKLQYFGPLTQTDGLLEKSLMQGKIDGRRRRGCQRMRWLDGITDAMDMNLGKLHEIVRERKAWVLQSRGLQRVGHNWVTEQQHVKKAMPGFLSGSSILSADSATNLFSSSFVIVEYHLTFLSPFLNFTMKITLSYRPFTWISLGDTH